MTLPFVDEIVDQLMEVATALDIDPELCCYNINGNIRILCD